MNAPSLVKEQLLLHAGVIELVRERGGVFAVEVQCQAAEGDLPIFDDLHMEKPIARKAHGADVLKDRGVDEFATE